MMHVMTNSLIFNGPVIFQVKMKTTENELVLNSGNTIFQYSSR